MENNQDSDPNSNFNAELLVPERDFNFNTSVPGEVTLFDFFAHNINETVEKYVNHTCKVRLQSRESDFVTRVQLLQPVIIVGGKQKNVVCRFVWAQLRDFKTGEKLTREGISWGAFFISSHSQGENTGFHFQIFEFLDFSIAHSSAMLACQSKGYNFDSFDFSFACELQPSASSHGFFTFVATVLLVGVRPDVFGVRGFGSVVCSVGTLVPSEGTDPEDEIKSLRRLNREPTCTYVFTDFRTAQT